MKTKNLITTLLLAASICNLSAQFNYGIRTGLNISELGTKKEENSIMGMQIGVSAEYFMPFSLGFRAGLFYSPKGSAYIDGIYNSSGKQPSSMNIRLRYLDLPIEVLYKLHIDEYSRIIIGAGGYFSYGLDGNASLKFDDTTIGLDSPFNDNDYSLVGHEGTLSRFNKWDYGLVFSTAFVYKHFVCGINYQYGLLDINGSLPVNSGYPSRNRTWNISIGYNFKQP